MAILAVLMIHSSQLVADLPTGVRNATFYGIRGVQLFFLVSGLTLMLNYAGKAPELPNFAVRRFFRIAPMFYIGIVLYQVLRRTTALSFPAAEAAPADIVATFLFLHGWLPSAINTVVPGGWSIAAEAMFYVVFPVLLILARSPRALTAVLAGTYAVAGAVNFMLRHVLPATENNATFAFSFWLVHLPAFLGGCWLAIVGSTLRPRRAVAFALLGLSVAGLLVDSQLRGRSNLLVAIALLTIFVWSCGALRPRWLEGKLLTLIGQISFSLYILQFAVLALLYPLAPWLEAAFGPLVALCLVFMVALIVAGALSYCSYRWVELPMIRVTRELGQRRVRARVPSN